MRPVNWKWFGLAWGFVFAVAAYDVYFAWEHRDTFMEWELNPAARWGSEHFGLPAVFTFKFAGLILAAFVAAWCLSRRRRSGLYMTLITASAHAILLFLYASHSPEPEAIEPAWLIASAAAGR
jgi:hypothetical protein